MQTGASLQMCMSDEDAAIFFATLKAGNFDTNKICDSIDCTTAKSTEKTDQAVILEEIQRTVGVDECNRRLRAYLQKQYNLVAINTTQTAYYQKTKQQAAVANSK